MNVWAVPAIVALGGYLIGSISFARIIFARLSPGAKPVLLRTPSLDGRAELVSHAVGATNVMVAFGARWGMFATSLDMGKAFLPTLLVRLLFPDAHYHLVCAAAVLVGHLWPVWYRFSGGGGNSSIIGMMLAISPVGVLFANAGGIIIGKLVPMFAFLGGVALTIPWFMWRDGVLSPEAIFAFVITLLYLAGQSPEIMQFRQLKKAGHDLDIEHTMRLMKGASKGSGHTSANERPGECNEE